MERIQNRTCHTLLPVSCACTFATADQSGPDSQSFCSSRFEVNNHKTCPLAPLLLEPSTRVSNKMPATWNDLSNEIRKIIIEYVVAGKTVTFVPRHAATRATRKKEDEEAQEPARFPLLLVSKQFLTYAELNDAVLKNATIKNESVRDLVAIDARFGKGGIENIRALLLVCRLRWRSPASLPEIPPKVRSRLKRLQKMTVSIDLQGPSMFDHPNLSDLVKVAKGQRLPEHPDEPWRVKTEAVRQHLQAIFEDLLYNLARRATQSVVKFLGEMPEESFERVIRFNITTRDPSCYQGLKEVCVCRALLISTDIFIAC